MLSRRGGKEGVSCHEEEKQRDGTWTVRKQTTIDDDRGALKSEIQEGDGNGKIINAKMEELYSSKSLEILKRRKL